MDKTAISIAYRSKREILRTAYASSTGRRYDLALLSLSGGASLLLCELPVASPGSLSVQPFTPVKIRAFNPGSRRPGSPVHRYFPHPRPGRCILERLPSSEE